MLTRKLKKIFLPLKLRLKYLLCCILKYFITEPILNVFNVFLQLIVALVFGFFCRKQIKIGFLIIILLKLENSFFKYFL